MVNPEREKWNAHWNTSHFSGRREDATSIISQFGIQSGTIVADLGCGDGYFTVPLIPHIGRNGIIYAVDSNSNALSILKNILDKMGPESECVRIMKADVSDTPLRSHSVDTVIFANIFHDLADKSRFLKEVKRIVKQSGMIVDIDWRRISSPFGPPQDIRIDEASAMRIMDENGLELIRSIDAGPYHYGLLLGVGE
jgi:ubiquinone/menaquinone biosynthesis C-methylase UbiE